MNKTFKNVMVLIDEKGKVTICSSEFNNIENKKELKELYTKKIAGRTYLNDDMNLIFAPYDKSNYVSSVWLKEQVGQTVVTRSPKAVKFALSLPVTMSQHQMIMTVLDESTRLSEALRNGLYERMVA
jgi:hypothetical protein